MFYLYSTKHYSHVYLCNFFYKITQIFLGSEKGMCGKVSTKMQNEICEE